MVANLKRCESRRKVDKRIRLLGISYAARIIRGESLPLFCDEATSHYFRKKNNTPRSLRHNFVTCNQICNSTLILKKEQHKEQDVLSMYMPKNAELNAIVKKLGAHYSTTK
ncbi:MAG: hypothetical protein ACJATE_001532, partial [Bacteroidia bacterium]